jgi:hypothetical protein
VDLALPIEEVHAFLHRDDRVALMHNLQAELFYKPHMVNGMMASADGPITTSRGSAAPRVDAYALPVRISL